MLTLRMYSTDMKKARIISHLQELDNIRRDEYMPQDVVDKVIELEKILTEYLAKELENNPQTVGRNGFSQNNRDNTA